MLLRLRHYIHNKTHNHVDMAKPGLATIQLCYRKLFSGKRISASFEFYDELEPICVHHVEPEKLVSVFEATTKLDMRRRVMEIKGA